MNIFALSPTGYDTVTFWTSEEEPGGCLIQLQHPPVCFAVVAITRDPEKPPEVGLLEIHQNLYKYLATGVVGPGHPLSDFDVVFHSTHSQVSAFSQRGGMKAQPEDVQKKLVDLRKEMNGNDLGARINPHLQKFYARQRGLWGIYG